MIIIIIIVQNELWRCRKFSYNNNNKKQKKKYSKKSWKKLFCFNQLNKSCCCKIKLTHDNFFFIFYFKIITRTLAFIIISEFVNRICFQLLDYHILWWNSTQISNNSQNCQFYKIKLKRKKENYKKSIFVISSYTKYKKKLKLKNCVTQIDFLF